MQYMKKIPTRCFVKIDYNVINSDVLTDRAELLYIRLSKLPQGSMMSNVELCRLFRMSEKTLMKAKKELEVRGLLASKQVTRSHYMSFLGNTVISAQEYMANYFKESSRVSDETEINRSAE